MSGTADCPSFKQQLLHPPCQQFSFRSKYHTENAVCLFIDKIRSCLDKGGVVGAVFLDLGKAFDTVNPSVLLTKLTKCNFLYNAVNWIQSYLHDQTESVSIDPGVNIGLSFFFVFTLLICPLFVLKLNA